VPAPVLAPPHASPRLFAQKLLVRSGFSGGYIRAPILHKASAYTCHVRLSYVSAMVIQLAATLLSKTPINTGLLVELKIDTRFFLKKALHIRVYVFQFAKKNIVRVYT